MSAKTEVRVGLVLQSGNAKIGPIPASITSSNTCPPTCGVRNECYAKFHFMVGHWKRVDLQGMSWEAFCEQVSQFAPGMIWRHNEAGDLPGVGNVIDVAAMEKLLEANKGRRGFTYSHKPVTGEGKTAKANREIIAKANASGFVINLSADCDSDADAKAALGIAPVTVLLPHNTQEKVLETKGGRKITVCPNSFDKRIQCWFCGLCGDAKRTDIIGFPAHGSARARATNKLRVLNG